MMIFGPAGRDAVAPQANPSRLINCYREPGARMIIRAIEGLVPYDDTGSVLAGDMIDLDGETYAIFSDQLFNVPGPAIATVARGEQFLSRNGTALTIVSGGRYFVWNEGVLTEPAGIFDAYGSVAYLAGRTVLSEDDGNRFEWSDINAPETLNGLNFASAEQRDDKLTRIMAVNGVLMAFGERSTEIWAATGAGGAGAFALLPGAVVDTGLMARKLAVDVGGAVFMVGDDGIAYMAASTQWAAVSIPAVNVAIKEGTPQACVYWESLGHKFAAITFHDRPAWVYDLATQEWWERATGRDGRWTVGMACRKGQSWLFGAIDGQVYEAGGNADMGKTLYHQATSGLLDQGGFFTVNEIEFGATYGFQTSENSLMLETSRDGVTWSRQGSVYLGQDGDFMKRAVFRRLGRSRKRAFRLSWGSGMSIYADATIK